MADSNATACLTCPSFNNQNINFREGNSLHDMFDAFVNTEFDPKKGKKDMKQYEQKFRKICRNLKIHLGSNSVETDIFNGIKAVMKRDFKEDLESGSHPARTHTFHASEQQRHTAPFSDTLTDFFYFAHSPRVCVTY